MTARDDLMRRLEDLEGTPDDTQKRVRRFYISSDEFKSYEEVKAHIDSELQPGERAIIFLESTL